MARVSEIQRSTAETSIRLWLDLDGTGASEIHTGVGFFDHMLTLLAKHGCIDLKVKAEGDLHVDAHHTVEDVGICLGQALKAALGDKMGIRRYGHALVPMASACSRLRARKRPLGAIRATTSCPESCNAPSR